MGSSTGCRLDSSPPLMSLSLLSHQGLKGNGCSSVPSAPSSLTWASTSLSLSCSTPLQNKKTSQNKGTCPTGFPLLTMLSKRHWLVWPWPEVGPAWSWENSYRSHPSGPLTRCQPPLPPTHPCPPNPGTKPTQKIRNKFGISLVHKSREVLKC